MTEFALVTERAWSWQHEIVARLLHIAVAWTTSGHLLRFASIHHSRLWVLFWFRLCWGSKTTERCHWFLTSIKCCRVCWHSSICTLAKWTRLSIVILGCFPAWFSFVEFWLWLLLLLLLVESLPKSRLLLLLLGDGRTKHRCLRLLAKARSYCLLLTRESITRLRWPAPTDIILLASHVAKERTWRLLCATISNALAKSTSNLALLLLFTRLSSRLLRSRIIRLGSRDSLRVVPWLTLLPALKSFSCWSFIFSHWAFADIFLVLLTHHSRCTKSWHSCLTIAMMRLVWNSGSERRGWLLHHAASKTSWNWGCLALGSSCLPT